MARIILKLEDEETSYTISEIPTTFEEIQAEVKKHIKSAKFRLKYNEVPIESTKDLLTAYLNDKADSLVLIIDEDISIESFIGNSLTDPLPKHFEVSDGKLSEEDLCTFTEELADLVQSRTLSLNRYFVQKRAEVYCKNEEEWNKIISQQLSSQQSLLSDAILEKCQQYSLTPDVFQHSCTSYLHSPSVASSLQRLAAPTETPVPESLTQEKLKEIMEYVCRFIEQFLEKNPNCNLIQLKMREGDEAFKKFGFDETQIASAIAKYDVLKLPEWTSIIDKYSSFY